MKNVENESEILIMMAVQVVGVVVLAVAVAAMRVARAKLNKIKNSCHVCGYNVASIVQRCVAIHAVGRQS